MTLTKADENNEYSLFLFFSYYFSLACLSLSSLLLSPPSLPLSSLLSLCLSLSLSLSLSLCAPLGSMGNRT